MTIQVTIGKWYAVSGAAGATVTTPDGSITLCTIPDGGQGYFNAPTTSVETSDDTVKVTQATFNLALAALGLLGGGVSELPKGYIKAEFLESTGVEYIDPLHVPSRNFGYEIKATAPLIAGKTGFIWGCQTSSGTKRLWGQCRSDGRFELGWNTKTVFIPYSPHKQTIKMNFLESNACYVDSQKINDLGAMGFDPILHFTIFKSTYQTNTNFDPACEARIFNAKFSESDAIILDLICAIDSQGIPCMYDKMTKQAFYNMGSGAFIVGFTLPQARKLRNLPAGGGELTISLPSNWQEDAAVVDAMATAEANGWVLPIQTYEAEAGAVSTFALRRIWVRKRAEQNGSYVAADGTRWQIDWCATMVGGDPQEYGYEPFRSVEAAAAYWELQPYVYPENEQLLTD